jgi:hypothetical protein
MNENEFVKDGKAYVAVEDDQELLHTGVYGCYQCVFTDIDCTFERPNYYMSGCSDRRSVHFEEKQCGA